MFQNGLYSYLGYDGVGSGVGCGVGTPAFALASSTAFATSPFVVALSIASFASFLSSGFRFGSLSISSLSLFLSSVVAGSAFSFSFASLAF